MRGSRVWPVAGVVGALLLAGTAACGAPAGGSDGHGRPPAKTRGAASDRPAAEGTEGAGQRVRQTPTPGGADASAPAGQAQVVTATYSCRGATARVRLTARPDQSSGRVRLSLVTKGFTTPVGVAPGRVRAVLVLAREQRDGATGRAVFRGSTPRLRPGETIRLGPLRGTVAPGDRLDSYRGKKRTALRIAYGKLRVDCRARSAQRPGPFRF